MHIKFIFTITLSLICITSLGITNPKGNNKCKNEIGIDVANILTFLSKRDESCLLNYKRHITENHTFRLGLNVEYDTDDDGLTSIGGRMGYEYEYPITNKRWQLNLGADIPFSFYKVNSVSNKEWAYGITPLIGVTYYICHNFSISSEIGLKMTMEHFRNPESFDKSANTDSFHIKIGSVGMIVVSYHFNLKKRSVKDIRVNVE